MTGDATSALVRATRQRKRTPHAWDLSDDGQWSELIWPPTLAYSTGVYGLAERFLKGTKPRIGAHDQVFFELLDLLRLRGHGGRSGLSIERDTCFVNIVGGE